MASCLIVHRLLRRIRSGKTELLKTNINVVFMPHWDLARSRVLALRAHGQTKLGASHIHLLFLELNQATQMSSDH